MKLQVTCGCGSVFQAPEHLAGQVVRCPSCRQPLSIPAAEGGAPPTQPDINDLSALDQTSLDNTALGGSTASQSAIRKAPKRRRKESGDSTISDIDGTAPSPPDSTHLLGTDDTARDVVARVIYGFRLSILFTIIVTGIASVVGIIAGAVQGFFGGWLDLVFQRLIEIWVSTPSLYIIIIMFAILGRSFWLLVFLTALFGWPALVGVVRAEFLRARNFEYIRAARSLGVSNWTIMFRHMLPNAMVATLTMLPFIITGTIGTLASLDFLGFGLPSSAPSLGELTLQAKQNLQAPWLGFTAFFTFAIMLSLLVFIFEGVRDAFDPRKAVTGGVPPEEAVAKPSAQPAMATVEPTAGPAATARRRLTKGDQSPTTETER